MSTRCGHFPASRTGAWCALAAALLAFSTWRADALQVRLATFNVLFGVGAPGSNEYLAVRSVLQRISPDVIAFQELMDSDKDNWITLAADMGYPYLAYGPSYGPLTGSQRLGFMSRFPISEAHELTEYPGATELTRYPLRITLNVPGALNPLFIYTVHLKASSGSVNQFRRGIEARRILTNLVAYVEANPLNTEYIVLGDFNEDVSSSQSAQFTALPSGLPASYHLGADVVFPVPYRVFPTDRFAPGGMEPIHPYQEDSAVDSTYSTGGRLDYLLFSEEIRTSPYGAPQGEIYNSTRDDGTGGLAKYGSPPASGTSATASDHFCVFADFNMIDSLSCVNPVLFISEIVDHPSGPTANYVELYNSGQSSLDLSNYAVVVYFDGSTPATIPLSGTLAGGTARLLAANAGAFLSTYGFGADQVATNLLALDGNDVVALLNPASQLSDLYGALGEPTGPTDFSMAWAYPSGAVQRVTGISDPYPGYLSNEWVRVAAAAATPGLHAACSVANIFYGSLRLEPTAPQTGQAVVVAADITRNLPASNLVPTAYYRLNGGAYQSAAMTLASNVTWKTAPLAVGAVAADDLYYYVSTAFSGPGAAPADSSTNLYEYPHAVVAPSGTNAAPRFNEISADDTSTDDREYVELVAPAGLQLGGYFMVHHNGASGTSGSLGILWRFDFPNFVFPNDGVTDVNGQPLGFCVIVTNGSTAIANADFAGFSGSLQNGPDALILYDPASNIVDAVLWQSSPAGAFDTATSDPGTVTTNGSPEADNYLHQLPVDSTSDTTLQAPNDVLGDPGAGWRVLTATPGALNAGQTSGFVRVGSAAVAIGDADADGFPDNVDNCPSVFNPTQSDNDGDGLGDTCDSDRDGDGIPDTNDNCVATYNADQGDLDGDGAGDACDPDRDGDGVYNDDDNCPDMANPDQADANQDGVGDVCDLDDDSDGVPDVTDNCPMTANADQANQDGDALGDVCDPDVDGDGVANETDNCPTTYNPGQADADNNGVGDACEIDTDADGVSDLTDNCLGLYNPAQVDGDGDGLGDACDSCTGLPTQTNLVDTGFATGLPSGWSVVSTGLATAVWRFDDPVFRGNRTGGTGVFAIAESSLYSRNSRMDTQLRTPAFDLSNVTTAQLAFSTFFDYYSQRSNEVADVDISVSGTNGPWVNLWRRSVDTSGRFAIDLTPYAGATNAVIRFHYYNAYQERYWQVDDVLVSCSKCAPPPDADGDGVGDPGDNCPAVFNPDQSDLDHDGQGDVCDADRDGDGLPDAWEQEFFGTPTGAVALADSDGDGLPNRDEFSADTVPTNSLSYFPAVTNANGGRLMVLTLEPTSTTRVYDVFWRTNLEQGSSGWQPFGLSRTGTGNAVTFTITNDQPLIFLRTGVRVP